MPTEITLRPPLIYQSSFQLVFFSSKAKFYEELWSAGVSLEEERVSVNAVGIGSVCWNGATEIRQEPHRNGSTEFQRECHENGSTEIQNEPHREINKEMWLTIIVYCNLFDRLSSPWTTGNISLKPIRVNNLLLPRLLLHFLLFFFLFFLFFFFFFFSSSSSSSSSSSYSFSSVSFLLPLLPLLLLLPILFLLLFLFFFLFLFLFFLFFLSSLFFSSPFSFLLLLPLFLFFFLFPFFFLFLFFLFFFFSSSFSSSSSSSSSFSFLLPLLPLPLPPILFRLLLLLTCHYSPTWSFASLMDFSQLAPFSTFLSSTKFRVSLYPLEHRTP